MRLYQSFKNFKYSKHASSADIIKLKQLIKTNARSVWFLRKDFINKEISEIYRLIREGEFHHAVDLIGVKDRTYLPSFVNKKEGLAKLIKNEKLLKYLENTDVSAIKRLTLNDEFLKLIAEDDLLLTLMKKATKNQSLVRTYRGNLLLGSVVTFGVINVGTLVTYICEYIEINTGCFYTSDLNRRCLFVNRTCRGIIRSDETCDFIMGPSLRTRCTDGSKCVQCWCKDGGDEEEGFDCPKGGSLQCSKPDMLEAISAATDSLIENYKETTKSTISWFKKLINVVSYSMQSFGYVLAIIILLGSLYFIKFVFG